MNWQAKQSLVEELGDKIQRAELVVLGDFTGLSVATMDSLRRHAEKLETAEVRVVKNTLCTRAIAGSEKEPLTRFLTGPTAVVMGFKDPVAPAKLVNDFGKDNAQFKIKAGFFSGRVIDASELKALASLPSRETLLGQLLGTLQAPMAQFVGVLAAAPQQFIGILSAYRDKLEKGE